MRGNVSDDIKRDNLLEVRPRIFSAGTYRTIFPWMAQETQYCSLRYILGTVYSGNTEASEISPVKKQN
jgi:hypothetical protein